MFDPTLIFSWFKIKPASQTGDFRDFEDFLLSLLVFTTDVNELVLSKPSHGFPSHVCGVHRPVSEIHD
jgi:hypothetical protein